MILPADVQTEAFQHIANAENAANAAAAIPRLSEPPVDRVGIIGAGTMGSGIAMAFVNAGYPVVLVETHVDALQRGIKQIDQNYSRSVKRGTLSEENKAQRMRMLTGSIEFDELNTCDLVIEAVFEDMAVKQNVLKKLNAIAKPGAIIATNTSYLDVNRLAVASGRPTQFIGLHFFSPANIMKLLEIVRGKETAPEIVASALSLAQRIGKVGVVVGVCHGFVGNRMLAIRNLANEPLLLQGASPCEIDKAFTDFGWAMGPFQMGDLAGLDISWRNRRATGQTAVLADTICESGQFGQKTGSGWYRYEGGSRTPLPNQFVRDLIEATADRLKIARRKIDAQEIIDRTLLPMINEGANILEEGIVQRASDIDLVWINGYGFPTAKGGPMWFADQIGLNTVVQRLESMSRSNAQSSEISPLLKSLAKQGRRLSTWERP